MQLLTGIALRNLLGAPRRTGLLSLAVGLVTMCFVLLLSVSQGIQDNLVAAATTVSAGHVNVSGFYKPTPTSAIPIVVDAAALRRVVETHTPGLAYVIDRHRGWAKIVSPTGSLQAGLSGIELAQEARLLETLAIEDGDPRRLDRPGTVMIFASQARRLEVGVGDAVTVQTETRGGQTNTADLTVVAVARDVGLLSAWAVFLPKQDVLRLYDLNADTTGALWVYLDDIDQATAVMHHLRQVLATGGYTVMDHVSAPFFFKFDAVAGEDWTGQRLDLTIWRDEVSFLTWILAAFDSLTGFLLFVLTAIIAVGITNALWSAVRERTNEIGTMRAIGMTRGRVLALFLIEAGMLGLGAACAGAGVGAVLARGVDAAELAVPVRAMEAILLSDTVNLAIRPTSLAAAVAAITALVVLAALWPAVRASRVPPVTAIHQVE